jgi:tRNA pseudouridine55 synthase
VTDNRLEVSGTIPEPTPSGVLIVDKPAGPSSFQVVAQARKLFGTKRVGHAGTLDPFATGVLVLVLGEASKLAQYLTHEDKAYEATIRFGSSTDTLDNTGTVLDDTPVTDGWSARSASALELALTAERERAFQVPPAFSAIKQDGQRSYARARRGEQVVLEPRPTRVERLECLSFDDQRLVVSLSVSKGYYVRALARDLCAHLGVTGHLEQLRRTRSGSFSLAEAWSWPRPEPVGLMSIDEAAARVLRVATLTDSGERRARVGLPLSADDFDSPVAGIAAWFARNGKLVAIGETLPDSARVTRGFVNP